MEGVKYRIHRKRGTLLIISFVHAILLVIATLVYLGSVYTFEDEEILIKYSSAVRRYLVNDREKPKADKFLFVGLTYEPMFIPKMDSIPELGIELQIGQDIITDRNSLGKFLSAVNKKPEHKILLMDVRFDDKSDSDSLLRAEL